MVFGVPVPCSFTDKTRGMWSRVSRILFEIMRPRSATPLFALR
jgi:hypothetical protein